MVSMDSEKSKEEIKYSDACLVIGSLFDEDEDEIKDKSELIESGEKLLSEDYKIKLHKGNEKLEIKESKLPKLYVENGSTVIVAGSSVIIECWDKVLKGRKYALKVPRPSQIDFIKRAKDAQSEAINSAQMSHVNVAHLSGLYKPLIMGYKQERKVQAPSSLIEWIDDHQSLSEYLYENCDNVKELLEILKQVLSGLQHIHDKGFIHWDIKSKNCIVTKMEGRPVVKILDIGNARKKSKSNLKKYEKDDFVFTSIENIPRWMEWEDEGEFKDSDRIKVSLSKGNITFDRPWLDLYMFGRMVGRILSFSQDQYTSEKSLQLVKRLFPPDDQDSCMSLEFLSIIYRRLTKWDETNAFNNAIKFKNHYYQSARHVLKDLNKLLPQFGAANNIRELHAVSQKMIRLPITHNTEHSQRVKFLINSSLFQRLREHNQLGYTNLVYPGAKHSRFEHSLGTWGTTIEYIRALYGDRCVPYFRLLCDEEHIQAILFASLIHDTGHGAFTHYLEEMSGLFSNCTHEQYIVAALTNNVENYEGGELSSLEKDHKELVECAKVWLAGNHNKANRITDENAYAFLNIVAEILSKSNDSAKIEIDLTDKSESIEICLQLLNSIVDSPIDSDKMDYVQRDAYHSGVDYAKGGDIERFYQSLSVAIHKPEDEKYSDLFKPTIAVEKKGIRPVESILLSRYQVFNSIYWHHTIRAITNVIQYLVWRYIYSPSNDDKNGLKSELEIESNIKDRRKKLLKEFKNRNDEDTIEWLSSEISSYTYKINRYGQEIDFNIAKKFLNRDSIPIRIFDLSYAESGYTESKDGIGKGVHIKQRVQKIICYNKLLNDLPLIKYCINKEKMLYEASRKTIDYAIKKIDDEDAKKELEKIHLYEANYFPDVPLKTKDQVDNLWVVGPNPKAQIHTTDIYQKKIIEDDICKVTNKEEASMETIPFLLFSPMGPMIKRAFRLWARRVRIFVDYNIKSKLEEYLGESEISNCAFKALEEGYEEAIQRAYRNKPEVVKNYLIENDIKEQYIPQFFME